MRPAYPSERQQELLDLQECLDESAIGDEEYPEDEYSDDVVSLLEENARLRGLVVTLTDIILKNVTERK